MSAPLNGLTLLPMLMNIPELASQAFKLAVPGLEKPPVSLHYFLLILKGLVNLGQFLFKVQLAGLPAPGLLGNGFKFMRKSLFVLRQLGGTALRFFTKPLLAAKPVLELLSLADKRLKFFAGLHELFGLLVDFVFQSLFGRLEDSHFFEGLPDLMLGLLHFGHGAGKAFAQKTARILIILFQPFDFQFFARRKLGRNLLFFLKVLLETLKRRV